MLFTPLPALSEYSVMENIIITTTLVFLDPMSLNNSIITPTTNNNNNSNNNNSNNNMMDSQPRAVLRPPLPHRYSPALRMTRHLIPRVEAVDTM